MEEGVGVGFLDQPVLSQHGVLGRENSHHWEKWFPIGGFCAPGAS